MNARQGSLDKPRGRGDLLKSPAAPDRGQQGVQGAGTSPLPDLPLGPGDSHRRSGGTAAPAGLLPRVRGDRTAPTPGGCNWELQAKFSAVPFPAGQGPRVAATQPEAGAQAAEGRTPSWKFWGRERSEPPAPSPAPG